MSRWMKLDNAAIIYPAVAKPNNSSIYRISMILKEPIRPLLLQKALDKAVRRYPMLSQRIRKGLFWRYMEPMQQAILIQKEEDYPCHPLQNALNQGQLIKVIYFNCRISIEVFHAVTDGTGAIEFLKTLVYEYLRLQGKPVQTEGLIFAANEQPRAEELEDAFRRYYQKGRPPKPKIGKAYQMTGTSYEPYGNNVVQGVLSASELNRVAKAQGASLTEFLLALLIYVICLPGNQPEQKRAGQKQPPVRISVPVNLRRVFPSQTLRNFFAVTTVEMARNQSHSLAEIIPAIKQQMGNNVQKKKLQDAIIRNINLEKIMIARFLPVLLKDLIVSNLFLYYNDKLRTCTVTNLGWVRLPQSLEPFVESMDVVFYPTANNPVNCGICTLKDKLTVSFARTITENQVVGDFFRYLSKECGLTIKLYSNEWGDFH